jgi:hypothetical protein
MSEAGRGSVADTISPADEEYSRERRGGLKREGNPLFLLVFAHLPHLDREKQRRAFNVH